MPEKKIVFFIGTIAEYIKLFTVIEAVKESGIPYIVIASGQNEIIDSDIAIKTGLHIDLQLSSEDDITKNVFGLFSWFFKYTLKSKKTIRETFSDIDFKNSVMVVHGDTLSTVMGAVLARRLHMKLAHVEAGLRSRHWFTPFPEEIDRHIVSKLSDINFCQNKVSADNLAKSRGITVETGFNTIIDSLNYSLSVPINDKTIDDITVRDYCVFVMHRQENLLKSSLVKLIVEKAIEVSKEYPVIFILHPITKSTLIKLNLLGRLDSEGGIILLDRVNYFDFMKLLNKSVFVITDGGSNQEELYYMGKPTLILRTVTERNEGLNENALLYNGDFDNIDSFIRNFADYRRSPVQFDKSPSAIIADTLKEEIS